MLTSEVNFESPDKSYYTFEYEDFKIVQGKVTVSWFISKKKRGEIYSGRG